LRGVCKFFSKYKIIKPQRSPKNKIVKLGKGFNTTTLFILSRCDGLPKSREAQKGLNGILSLIVNTAVRRRKKKRREI
jgi:hypothetical protein